MHLTVIHPFSEYAKGDKIYDHEEITEVLDGENSRHVVRTADQGDPVNGAKAV